MKQSEIILLEFAGYCYINKPELANDLNTLIAGFINKPKEQLPIQDVAPKVKYCECKREHFIKREGIKEYCSMCRKEVK